MINFVQVTLLSFFISCYWPCRYPVGDCGHIRAMSAVWSISSTTVSRL